MVDGSAHGKGVGDALVDAAVARASAAGARTVDLTSPTEPRGGQPALSAEGLRAADDQRVPVLDGGPSRRVVAGPPARAGEAPCRGAPDKARRRHPRWGTRRRIGGTLGEGEIASRRSPGAVPEVPPCRRIRPHLRSESASAARHAPSECEGRHLRRQCSRHPGDAVFDDGASIRSRSPIWAAANRKMSGAGLPCSTWSTLKIRPSNRSKSPVLPRVNRILS